MHTDPARATHRAPPRRCRAPQIALLAISLMTLGALAPAHAADAAPSAAPPASPATPPAAAPGSTGIDASGDYQREMQACRQGRSPQDRATCMEEAREARKARRQGGLDTPAQSSMGANAMARCEHISGTDMAACRARMMGYGRVTGSVAGGGMLRELEVVEMLPGQDSVNVAPKGNTPVLVVPAQGR